MICEGLTSNLVQTFFVYFSKNKSNTGFVHGSIFFTILPGRYPISSSTVTTGRVIIILLISCFFNKSIAFKKEPNIKLSQIANLIPKNMQKSRYNLYFIEQTRYWENNPLYVFDEWIFILILF